MRPQSTDSNGSLLPANRCVFPDDWEFIAGGAAAESTRPSYDIMKAPDSSFLPATSGCQLPDRAAGPISGLDRALADLFPPTPANLCGDSLAPHVAAGFPCRFPIGSCRETVFPDSDVDASDAPMPPSLVRLLLTGEGFLKGTDKASVYTGNSNPFYVTHIPAERWISPINSDLSGYQWNTWGTGSKSGVYRFWTSFAEKGPEVMSCPGSSPCPGFETPTGGYAMIKIYSDNHGEAMAWVNGNANLIEGTSTVNAVADYPDQKKHFPLGGGPAEIDWSLSTIPTPPVGGLVDLPIAGSDGSVPWPMLLAPVAGVLALLACLWYGKRRWLRN